MPLVLLLAGCAGTSTSAGSAGSAQTSAPVPAAGQASGGTEGTAGSVSTEASPPLDGADAASALSGFACSPAVGVSQRWTATGTLTNDDSEDATFRTTVVVVDSTGTGGIASQRLVDVEPGMSTEVDLGRVRGPLDGTCQVQVLRLS